MKRKTWSCEKCQGAPEMHRIDRPTIRIWRGYWVTYAMHTFVMPSER